MAAGQHKLSRRALPGAALAPALAISRCQAGRCPGASDVPVPGTYLARAWHVPGT